MTSTLDADVARTCAAYLELADRYEPGLVQGLYLQGSLALGDYRPGISDIDFVAVTSRAPIRGRWRRFMRRCGVPMEGSSSTGPTCAEDALRRDPEVVPDGPSVHEWRVEAVSRFERSLVTWHVLAQGGIAVRGPAVAGSSGRHCASGPARASRCTATRCTGTWT